MRRATRVALAGLLIVAVSMCAGCGYLKNVRDDFMDIGTAAIGFVPAVMPTEKGPMATGALPPAIGAYIQFTDFLHLGAITKATLDLEWDRRGFGIVGDCRTKVGIGPFHYINIRQEPIHTNAYKVGGNQLDGWREHMRGMRDMYFGNSAKVLLFPRSFGSLPFHSRGWQDWANISVELAIPDPIVTHSGFYARLGVNPCQMFDALLSIVGLDLYQDNAFTFSGDLKYPN